MIKFTEETSQEDLINFAHSLSPGQLKYKDVLAVYGEHYTHAIYSNHFVMKFSPRYFQKKKKNHVQRSMPVEKPVFKNIAPKWTEAEIEALRNGVKEFGLGKWKEIYYSNKKIFEKNMRTPEKLKRKYLRDMKNKKEDSQ